MFLLTALSNSVGGAICKAVRKGKTGGPQKHTFACPPSSGQGGGMASPVLCVSPRCHIAGKPVKLIAFGGSAVFLATPVTGDCEPFISTYRASSDVGPQ